MPIRLTQTVKRILWSYGFLFFLARIFELFFNVSLFEKAALSLDVVSNYEIWRIFTYSFFHEDGVHLFFNLLILAFIGSELELIWRAKEFIRYYFTCTVGTGFLYLFVAFFLKRGGMSSSPLLGPMGGIYGLFLAYGIFFGERVLLFMMLFPMKAKHFVWVLAAFDFLTSTHVSHGNWVLLAPLAGVFVGFGYFGLRIQISNKIKKKSFKHQVRYLKAVPTQQFEFEDTDSSPSDRPKTWH